MAFLMNYMFSGLILAGIGFVIFAIGAGIEMASDYFCGENLIDLGGSIVACGSIVVAACALIATLVMIL